MTKRMRATNMDTLHLIQVLFLCGTLGTPVEQMAQYGGTIERHQSNPTNHTTFNWARCDKIGSPIHISYLNIQPDPIILGEVIYFSIDAHLGTDIGNTPLEFDADVKMKIGGRYERICYILSSRCYRSNICDNLLGISCPLKAGNLSMTYPYNPQKPPFLISGLFEATVVFREDGKDIACVELWFSLQS